MAMTRRALLASFGVRQLARSEDGLARDLCMLPLAEVRRLLQSRRVSPIELVEACYTRIVRLNSQVNAYITVDIDGARKQVRRLERIPLERRGLLHGIPIGIKDNIETAGLRTTAASGALFHNVPSRDAEVVRLLKSAGAIIIGKHNLHEFAHGGTSAISRFGPVHNPWNLDYSPGGSSGGSAAAVATGMCYGAVGTDTGGSVRIPASCCGVVGLKPTLRGVSTTGVIPEAQSMDCVGPICRSVEDIAYMLAAMAPANESVVRDLGASVANLRVGVLENYLRKTEDSVGRAFEGAVGVIKSLTVDVRMFSLPELPKAVDFVFDAENYRNHRDRLRRRGSLYQPETRQDLLNSARVTSAQYKEGLNSLRELRSTISRTFEEFDVLICPTLRTEPPLLSRSKGPFDIDGDPTAVFNVYGLPAVSVLCGFSTSGLPIGLEIGGPVGGENTVLALAHRFESVTDWHKRRPSLAG